MTTVLLLGACAPMAQTAPSQGPAGATPAPSVTATFAPATPTAEPSSTPVAPPVARLDDPVVTLATTPISVARTLALKRSAVSPGDEEAARWGIEWYLQGLDRYRDNGDFLPVSGAFGKAVAAALVESRTPGVKRTFVLESLRIEALYRKPWGTQALADVRVTIIDRAVDRSAPDQRELGLLRLSGDRRLQVIDAWDDSRGRWFNERATDSEVGLRESIAQALASHLRMESWVVGVPKESSWREGTEATPFTRARAAYLATFDRAAIASRTFAEVTGVVERFDTFAEISGGIATVRFAATVLATDAAGRTERQPVARRVKVFFGNWMPEVVDEEVTPGVWRSGGDLALATIDVNRA
jgi:hypothetical protein